MRLRGPTARRRLRMGSRAEEELAVQVQVAGLPEPEREFRFHPARKWRFDFSWPDRRLAVEVEGGVWTQGRHVRGQGFEADCEKYAEAVAMGWRVMRVTPRQIRDGRALDWITRALRREA
ncbi:endonuclease domain-containing protein [Deferrisoma camini]|uniref:endonuclease domain-containing protein n=1 Tax=Deferrisoma camini TaxID=1035120 RepID=UPI0004B11EB4|nr:endonuclease domain-containing protein [Deferrisoma camini]